MTQPLSSEDPPTVQLVRAAQVGDSGALQELAKRYLPRVRQIVSLRLGAQLRRHAELEDYVQDAFVRVLSSLDTFVPSSEGTFRNWLACCVEREIIDQARFTGAKKRGEGNVQRFGDYTGGNLHSSIFAGTEPTPSAVARAAELGDAIEAALLAMPKYQRELIVLRTLCGMSHAEVADELGLPTETASRMACSRALRLLKEQIGLS